ncbi:MAG TPA: hypothetical protein VEC57_17960 [Candidatus Limnocylindrales bacterium]|nr:hypothetical protein [Candidatus Limnocylindrales bacterium]
MDKGFRYLAELLRNPGRDYLATELLALAAPRALGAHALDARARLRYRRRLAELRADLDEARTKRDRERVSIIRAEIRLLSEQLGLGGAAAAHALASFSAATSAVAVVSQGIRDAIGKLRATDPALANHLAAAIRTGRVCTYTPKSATRDQ